MKNPIIFLLIFNCLFSFGQKINIMPNGFRDLNDSTKTYVVIDAPGKSATELYETAIKYINKNYKSPDDVIKGKIDGEYLKFITHEPALFMTKNGGVKLFFEADYTIEMNFKDNRVKYEIISFDSQINNVSNQTTPTNKLYFTGGTFQWSIYNKEGVLRRPEIKADIEDYFNAHILTLADALQGKKDKNDW